MSLGFSREDIQKKIQIAMQKRDDYNNLTPLEHFVRTFNSSDWLDWAATPEQLIYEEMKIWSVSQLKKVGYIYRLDAKRKTSNLIDKLESYPVYIVDRLKRMHIGRLHPLEEKTLWDNGYRVQYFLKANDFPEELSSETQWWVHKPESCEDLTYLGFYVV